MNKLRMRWLWLIGFIDVPSGVIMGALTGAIIYRIVIGDNIDVGTASCYATAIGAFAGTKISQHWSYKEKQTDTIEVNKLHE